MMNCVKLIVVAFGVFVFGGCSSNAADLPINQLPMYDYDAPKTDMMRTADATYIENAIELKGSRKVAARAAIDIGWQYFETGDLATAMKRFNQAYLLDPLQGDAYAGMAVVVSERDHDDAGTESLFRRAVASEIHTAITYRNYGTFLVRRGRMEEARHLLATGVVAWPEAYFVRMMYALALVDTGQVEVAQVEMTYACGDAQRTGTYIGRRETEVVIAMCTGFGIALEP